MDYTKTIKTAYIITRHYPRLWLLGLFLGSGFTLQLLSTYSKGFSEQKFSSFQYLLPPSNVFNQGHWPILLVCLGVGLVLTNWVKVVLIQHLRIALKLDMPKIISVPAATTVGRPGVLREPDTVTQSVEGKWYRRIMRNSQQIVHVTGISIFTTFVLLAALSVVYLPFVTFARHSTVLPAVSVATMVVVVFLIFIVSCVGMFGSFYVVLFKTHYKPAINLATDLLIAKWYEVVGMIVLLVVIYAIAFLVGFVVCIFMGDILQVLLGSVAHFRLFDMIPLVPVITGLIMWVWLAILNVFFYTAMLLFFSGMVQPKKDPAEAVQIVPEILNA